MMMQPQGKPITHYSLKWATSQQVGVITVFEQATGAAFELRPMGPDEFHAVTTMLRNERPIFFNSATGDLWTGKEMVGEEEID